MAFADGVSLSSARRSLRCLLFSSSSRPHATAAGWNHPLLLLLLLHRVAGHEDGAHGGGVPRARVHVGGGVGHVRACGCRGMPFAAEASVNCVAAHQPMVARGRPGGASERIHRERFFIPRRVSHQEQISSFMYSLPDLGTPFFGQDLLPSGHLHRWQGYHRTPSGLEEIMMFQSRVWVGGGLDVYDRFRDWRLDVDNRWWTCSLYSAFKRRSPYHFLSLQELLELGEKSGIICQEEYVDSDETGRLECGHGYHMHCIKQWLLLKNACPVCKSPVLKA
ncbi:hypothetical protein OPV22_033435 [Ensete ventricosum]|uniref:RING-type E3 ubiquitin transferase n=1 Tax=Ensete ventricosum TaxID=4639 RepID=A0AAV8PMN1_ENSVE|nr:hypothetical protein OPV22_033435 [Ensete ventricosum]